MIVKICFFAILSVAVSSVIKQVKPEMTPFVRVGSAVTVGVFAVGVIAPLVTYMTSLFSQTGMGEWEMNVLKALGVALISQICADICRDCGETGAANSVETIAKLEILMLCLPMLSDILETAGEVLSY